MCWTWSNPLENGYRLTYTTGLAEESEQQQKKSRKKESNRSHVKRISFHLFALLFNVTLHLCLISYARPPSVPLRWNPPPSGGTRAADGALSLSQSGTPKCPTSSVLNSISHFRSATKSPEIQSSCLFSTIPNNLIASYLRSHHVHSIWSGDVYVFVYYTQGRSKHVPNDWMDPAHGE